MDKEAIQTKSKIQKRLAVAVSVCALAALICCPSDALESSKYGLDLCARVIVPSLLPFFVVCSVLNALGLPAYLGSRLTPLTKKLFGVGGAGAAAFVLGCTGGYPLGASVIADMRKSGDISASEGENLISFCNNSGPAFIIGAAGVGIFRSSGAGLILYFSHIAAAVMTGVLLSKRAQFDDSVRLTEAGCINLSSALPDAVRKSVVSVLNVCGFVITFSVLNGLLDSSGFISLITGYIAAHFGMELHFVRAFLTGILELGSGIGAMEGLAPNPINMALCSFILGWGGISVHFQTMAVIADTDIKGTRHFAGRLVCGLISASITLLISGLFF